MSADANDREENGLPTGAKVAIGLQAFLLLVIVVVWAAWASWGRPSSSLIFSSVVFGPSIILCTASVIGMARGKMYGWIAGLVGSLVTCVAFAVFATALTVFPLGMIGVLMLRSIREFFSRNYYS